MGAVSLLPPGTRTGPCASACDHKTCLASRKAAEALCQICCKPNGYGVAVYLYATKIGHAECLDEARKSTIKTFLAGLAKRSVHRFIARKWPPIRLAGPSEEGGPCRGRCRHPECAEHRKASRAACSKCSKPIGYRRLHVWRPEGVAHADCAGVSLQELNEHAGSLQTARSTPITTDPRLVMPELDFDFVVPVGPRWLAGLPKS